jgi:hypothetical protein
MATGLVKAVPGGRFYVTDEAEQKAITKNERWRYLLSPEDLRLSGAKVSPRTALETSISQQARATSTLLQGS